jgi:predicted transcriptional regulator
LFAVLSDRDTLEILALLEKKKSEKWQIVAHFGRVEPPIKEKLDKLVSEGYVVLEKNRYSLRNNDITRLIKLASKCIHV